MDARCRDRYRYRNGTQTMLSIDMGLVGAKKKAGPMPCLAIAAYVAGH